LPAPSAADGSPPAHTSANPAGPASPAPSPPFPASTPTPSPEPPPAPARTATRAPTTQSARRSPPAPSGPPIDLDLVTVVASNPLAPLDQWVTTWWHDGDQHADTITWLTRHLDRACDERTDIPAFATDLNAVARQLRAAAQDGRQLLGHCPTEDCDRPLYAELRDQDVTCPGCSTTWPRRHWLWLADTLRTAA
jgi:hypothetical protein